MSDIYYRGQNWWDNDDHCRHDGSSNFTKCYKCDQEQYFNHYLIEFANILHKLGFKKQIVPDADNEFILDLCANAP